MATSKKTAIDLPPAKNVDDASWIQFDYGRPVTIRGVTLASFIAANYYDGLSPSTCNGTPKAIFRFDSSDASPDELAFHNHRRAWLKCFPVLGD